MAAYPPRSVTPDERAEERRKKAAEKKERKYLADTMKVTLSDIEYALRKFNGSVKHAAEWLGTESFVLRRKIRMNPTLVFLLQQLKEDRVDEAEFQNAKLVSEGYFPAIALTLKTLGQNRGYTERSTIEHEMSEKGVRDAASLIEALRRSLSVEEMKTIELKEEEWEVSPIEVSEERLLPLS